MFCKHYQSRRVWQPRSVDKGMTPHKWLQLGTWSLFCWCYSFAFLPFNSFRLRQLINSIPAPIYPEGNNQIYLSDQWSPTYVIQMIFGHQRKERKERYRALSSSPPMWDAPTRERKEANKWGRLPSPRPGWQTPCAPEKEFHKIFTLWNLSTFRHDEFIRLLSFITAGTRWLWALTTSLSHLQECSPPRWQRENFWRASSRPRWSCQGSSDRALLERNSATRSDFSCPSPQEFEFADLGKSSPPPSATPPSHALLALFAASWGRLEVEICLYKSIQHFSPEMPICWS